MSRIISESELIDLNEKYEELKKINYWSRKNMYKSANKRLIQAEQDTAAHYGITATEVHQTLIDWRKERRTK